MATQKQNDYCRFGKSIDWWLLYANCIIIFQTFFKKQWLHSSIFQSRKYNFENDSTKWMIWSWTCAKLKATSLIKARQQWSYVFLALTHLHVLRNYLSFEARFSCAATCTSMSSAITWFKGATFFETATSMSLFIMALFIVSLNKVSLNWKQKMWKL